MSTTRPEGDEKEATLRASRRRRLAAVVWTLAGLHVVSIGVGAWLHVRAYASHAPADVGRLASIGTVPLFSLGFTAFAVVGAAIVTRRPRNAVGWVMVGTTVASMVSLLSFSYGLVALGDTSTDPPAVAFLAAWISPVTSTLTVVLAFTILPLLFPNGRLPSPRWRIVVWIAVALVAVETVRLFRPRLRLSLSPIGAEEVEIVDIANPLATDWAQHLSPLSSAALPLILVLALAAVAAVVVRFRRSQGVERQQMKWFVYAGITVIVGLMLLVAVTALGLHAQVGIAFVVIAAFGAYPIAVGVAILRYRLYEIDRLVSRTVTYGLVVAVLAGVYVVTVVGLGAATTAATGAGDSDLVVALATLAVAGLFQPVRRRIRSGVDRRFNRTGYDARRAVDGFTQQVRDEVDLAAIRGHLAATAAVAAEPEHVSVWIAGPGERGA